MHTARIVLTIALTLFAAAAAGEMYTWKDAEGRTHFGDKPPPEVRNEAREIEAEAYAPGSDEGTREVYERTNRMFDANRKIEAEKEQQELRKTRKSEVRDISCRSARDRVRRLSGRIMFVDDDGKEVKVTEEERRQKIAEVQEWIARNCN